MPEDVLPLALYHEANGLRCLVHCPMCVRNVIVDPHGATARCPCGVELHLVLDRTLHGTAAVGWRAR